MENSSGTAAGVVPIPSYIYLHYHILYYLIPQVVDIRKYSIVSTSCSKPKV